MKKLAIFLLNLIVKCKDERILEKAGGLTFRVLLAFFPFVLFLFALIGFLNFDEGAVIEKLRYWLSGYDENTNSSADIIFNFINETAHTRNRGLLSAGLFFAVYNTSNGFRAVIRATNSAFGFDDRRGIFRHVLISLALMLLFAFFILMILGLLVFIYVQDALYMPLGAAMSLVLLVATTLIIYRLSLAEKMRLRHLLPGAMVAVFLWIASSAVFGFFIANFTQYSAIYGSIAGIFILILWLNLISVILLLGVEVNSVKLGI